MCAVYVFFRKTSKPSKNHTREKKVQEEQRRSEANFFLLSLKNLLLFAFIHDPYSMSQAAPHEAIIFSLPLSVILFEATKVSCLQQSWPIRKEQKRVREGERENIRSVSQIAGFSFFKPTTNEPKTDSRNALFFTVRTRKLLRTVR